ncbi:MAG: tyrosine-type recombinase/integrase [Cyclobacteriaceae bacterium]
MAKKGSYTESSPMSWEQFLNLVARMIEDAESIKNQRKRAQHVKFITLISTGCYAGLRIGDILNLRWKDILEKESIEIVEEKRKKRRLITLNPNLTKTIAKCFLLINPPTDANIFTNSMGGDDPSVMTVQYINRKLKSIFKYYKVKIAKVSSHTLRKTFGRRVYELNYKSDDALIKLSQMFNHANTAITRRYIGIQQETIKDIYLNL